MKKKKPYPHQTESVLETLTIQEWRGLQEELNAAV